MTQFEKDSLIKELNNMRYNLDEIDECYYDKYSAANEMLDACVNSIKNFSISIPISPCDDIWYVDQDSLSIDHGKVVLPAYNKDMKLDSISVEFDSDGDFDVFYGDAVGDCLFTTKEDAKLRLCCE